MKQYKFSSRQKHLKNLGLMFILLFLSTAIAILLFHLTRVNSINIALIYILALIITAHTTDGYIYGITFALLSVIAMNYFFTYPYLKLNFFLTGYPLTFLIMLAITLITSATTSHLKIQTALLAEKEETLNKAEKEKMRANLLRAISHDLRTPLTGIICGTDSYLQKNQTLTEKEKKEIVKKINDDANWLLNMVENLLTVTRIKDDDSKVTKTSEIVEEVVSEAIIRFKKRQPNATVLTKLPKDYILLPMDPLLIEQVIINLLENAYVHSNSRREILFFIDTDDTIVSFHIRDYGKGIDSDILPTIFDGCGTRTANMPDAHRGMGIGLSICKTIIDAHDGKIIAENKEEGAEFTFTLNKEESL